MQDEPGVVEVAVVLGAVDTVSVTKLGRQAVDADVPVVTGSTVIWVEWDLGVDCAIARLGKDERDGRPMPAEQDEIDAGGRRDGACRQRTASGNDERAIAVAELDEREVLRLLDHLRHFDVHARSWVDKREDAGNGPAPILGGQSYLSQAVLCVLQPATGLVALPAEGTRAGSGGLQERQVAVALTLAGAF